MIGSGKVSIGHPLLFTRIKQEAVINVIKEEKQMRSLQLFVLCMLAVSSSAWSVTRKASTHYPDEIQGYWIPEEAPCPKAGESFDGDSAMRIGPRMIQGHEDRSTPKSVVLISKQPMAWRIVSLIDVGPSEIYEQNEPQIFVVGEQRITVVSYSHAQTYRKCSDTPKHGS